MLLARTFALLASVLLQTMTDGAISWTLDAAGRIASSSHNRLACSYEHNHPLGLLTGKHYGTAALIYGYDNSAYLSSITDGTNSMTYTSRTAAGLPLAADFNGTQVSWQYQYARFVSQLKYTAQVLVNGQQQDALLAEWDATDDPSGLRRTLTNGQLHESTTFDYDEASRLARETRTIGADTTVTAYLYDAVGNRISKIVNGTTENYTYSANSRYELNEIAYGDGSLKHFTYDANGNTLSWSKEDALQTPLESQAYAWDALNRLTEVRKVAGDPANPSARSRASFAYDAGGWQLKTATVQASVDENWAGSSETREFSYGALLSRRISAIGPSSSARGAGNQPMCVFRRLTDLHPMRILKENDPQCHEAQIMPIIRVTAWFNSR